MKKIDFLKTPLIASALFMFIACNNAPAETKTADPAETTEAAVADESHEGHTTAVQLNNGEKWDANVETTEGIQKMQTIVTGGLTSSAAPAEVLPALETEFKTIFDKCTMTGEAHDQLHNYLVPVKNHLDELKTATAAAPVLTSLQEYLGTYSNYFK